MQPLPDDLNKVRGFLLQAGILEKWHTAEWSQFVGAPSVLALVQGYVQNFAAYRAKGEGIVFWGPNGTGKTLLLNLAARELLRVRQKVQIVSFSTIVSEFTKNWRGEGSWAKLREIPVLCIEELDKSFKATAVSQELVQAALDALLRYRVQRMKPTLATTNLAPSDFAAVFGKSISSLFKEAGMVVEVTGPDFRDRVFDRTHGNLGRPSTSRAGGATPGDGRLF